MVKRNREGICGWCGVGLGGVGWRRGDRGFAEKLHFCRVASGDVGGDTGRH